MENPPPSPPPTYAQPTPPASLEMRVYDLERRIAVVEDHDRRSWVFSTKLFKRSAGIVGDLFFILLLFGVLAFSFYGLVALMGG